MRHASISPLQITAEAYCVPTVTKQFLSFSKVKQGLKLAILVTDPTGCNMTLKTVLKQVSPQDWLNALFRAIVS